MIIDFWHSCWYVSIAYIYILNSSPDCILFTLLSNMMIDIELQNDSTSMNTWENLCKISPWVLWGSQSWTTSSGFIEQFQSCRHTNSKVMFGFQKILGNKKNVKENNFLMFGCPMKNTKENQI